MKKVIIKNKTFVLFLTGHNEKNEFDNTYDFELAKKEAEQGGDGFRCYAEVIHNNELLIIELD